MLIVAVLVVPFVVFLRAEIFFNVIISPVFNYLSLVDARSKIIQNLTTNGSV